MVIKMDIDNQILENFINIYSGILANNQKFATKKETIDIITDDIIYEFDLKEFVELKEKYNLEYIAEGKSDFERAVSLLKYFSPKLTHSSWYDNHIECNALRLLEYSFDNPNQGINCLNKSKILEECLLAIGIYARRVGVMPYSPYDFDNHVVVEMFDRSLNKWIMLDPTTNGYFIDENKHPLSLLEIRDKFANDEFVTYIDANFNLLEYNSLEKLEELKESNLEQNVYICKNLFYFTIDKKSTFGYDGNSHIFLPTSFSLKSHMIQNLKYRIKHMPKEYEDFIEDAKKRLEKIQKRNEFQITDINVMIKSPLDK